MTNVYEPLIVVAGAQVLACASLRPKSESMSESVSPNREIRLTFEFLGLVMGAFYEDQSAPLPTWPPQDVPRLVNIIN